MSIYLQTEKKLDGYISNMTTSKRTNKLVRFSVARCIFYKCIIKMIKNTPANSYGTLFLKTNLYKKNGKRRVLESQDGNLLILKDSLQHFVPDFLFIRSHRWAPISFFVKSDISLQRYCGQRAHLQFEYARILLQIMVTIWPQCFLLDKKGTQ